MEGTVAVILRHNEVSASRRLEEAAGVLVRVILFFLV
jgi:DUF1009 family protein